MGVWVVRYRLGARDRVGLLSGTRRQKSWSSNRYLSPEHPLAMLYQRLLGVNGGRGARGRASVSAHNQEGASSCRANVLRPVTGDNRVAARQGGKQSEVNDQSVMRAVTKGPR